MSSSSRSPSPNYLSDLANSSDTTHSIPDKEETPSELDEREEEFSRRKAAASTIAPPKGCKQDNTVLVASLR